MTNENDQDLTRSSQQKLTKYSSDLIKKGLGLAKSIQSPDNNAEYWSQKGNTLLSLGACEEALICYEQALKLDSYDSLTWHNRGSILNSLKRYKEALNSFNKALEIDPNNNLAWSNVAKILGGKFERYDEAIYSYNKALELDENDWESWWLRGVDLQKLGHYEEAAESYNKSLQINQANWTVWMSHGNNFESNMNQHEDAIFCYDKALDFFDSKLIEFTQIEEFQKYTIWMIKGTVLSKLEHHEEAFNSYQKALEFTPNKHESLLWFVSGSELCNLYRYTEAIFCFNKVLKIDPKNRDSWYSKGLIFKEINLYEDALFCYKEALSLTDEDSEEWDNIFQEIINIEETIENSQTIDYLKKHNIKKTSQELCIEGLDEYAKREHQLAIHKFTEAIEVDSDYALAYKCRGYIHFKTRNYLETINDLTHFINLNSADIVTLKFRAIAYYKLGQHKEAIGDLTEIEDLYLLDMNIEQYNKISHLIKIYEEWKTKIESSSSIEFDEDEDEDEDDCLDNSNSEFFKSLIMLGDFAYESGNFESSIEYYTSALTFDPNNSQIYNKRSTARSAIKDYQGAMEDLQKVRQLST